MEDIVKAARESAQARLREKGRLDFGDISKHIVREHGIREWVIRDLVESGTATVEFDFATGGRPRSTLVLIA